MTPTKQEFTRRLAAGLLFAILGLALAGCDRLQPATPIKDILAAPATFEGKTLKLKGKVRDITKIPLVDIRAYTLADDGGAITVTTEGALPAQGAEMSVQVSVESAAIIGGQAIGLRARELQRY